MASPDPTDTVNRLLPFLGALHMDLRRMARSRLVQGWLAVTAFIAFGAIMSGVENEKGHESVDVLWRVLSTYIFVWSTLAIVLSAGAIPSETGVVADSILSRGITRHAYILSKYVSRIVTVVSVCLVVLVPTAYFASLHLDGALTPGGTALAILYVLMHMVCLTALGVTFSVWFNSPFPCIATLWAICYFFGSICSIAFKVNSLTPARLVDGIRNVLEGNMVAAHPWQVIVGFGIPTLVLPVLGLLSFSRRDV